MEYKRYKKTKVTEGFGKIKIYPNIKYEWRSRLRARGQIKYGFLMNELNPFFYNFIHNNPQWMLYNKNIRVVYILFRIFQKTNRNWLSSHSLCVCPKTQKIIERVELKASVNNTEITCLKCGNNIIVKTHERIGKKQLHCNICTYDKTDEYRLKMFYYLKSVTDKIADENIQDFNKLKEYIKRNSNA